MTKPQPTNNYMLQAQHAEKEMQRFLEEVRTKFPNAQIMGDIVIIDDYSTITEEIWDKIQSQIKEGTKKDERAD